MSRTRVVLVGLLGFVLVLLVMLAGPGSTAEAVDDGRLTCHSASPIVIYCTDDGVLILSPTGQSLLHVPTADIEAAVIPPLSFNVEVGSTADGTLGVYWDGKSYVVRYDNVERGEQVHAEWSGCGDDAQPAEIRVYDRDTRELKSNASGCGEDGTSPPAPVAAPVVSPDGLTCVEALAACSGTNVAACEWHDNNCS
ncbi:hypothetical protein ACFLYO_08980 [Chloroflexota bacterium]